MRTYQKELLRAAEIIHLAWREADINAIDLDSHEQKLVDAAQQYLEATRWASRTPTAAQVRNYMEILGHQGSATGEPQDGQEDWAARPFSEIARILWLDRS